jgi:hypothetical protein
MLNLVAVCSAPARRGLRCDGAEYFRANAGFSQEKLERGGEIRGVSRVFARSLAQAIATRLPPTR